MICEICKKNYNSYKGLSSHIRQTHKITSEEYYIQYINSQNTCKICNKRTNFRSLGEGFYTYCSADCVHKDIDIIDKQNQTFRNNPNNIINAKKHMITYNKSVKGKANSKKVGLKTGSTNITNAHNKYDGIKYCVNCNINTKHIIGIGCLSCYNKSDEHKQKIIKSVKQKYGEQYINVFQVPEIKEKSIQTSIKRYNTTNAGNSREARIKANNTMRQKGNYSRDEDYFAEELTKLNIKFKTQYKSDKYPFMCDFYLSDYDIYIELNIYWSHNNHFFDINDENDINTLIKWQQKSQEGHKQYTNAIIVWTKKDILKRDIAQKNNLNYVVLWSRKEIEFYINYLKILLNVEQEILNE